jgi:hypothetical protein
MTHKIIFIAAAAAISTSATTTHAWLMTDHFRSGRHQHQHQCQQHQNRCFVNNNCDRRKVGSASPLFFAATPRVATGSSLSLWTTEHSKRIATTCTATTTITTTRSYSSSNLRNRSNNNDDDNNNDNENRKRNELFGFRRAAKSAARKVLPTKWFGSKEEKEALERKQLVKDRVKGELDQMLKGAPLFIQMFGKYIAAPMMGKIASKLAEVGRQQQETMEAILDEARTSLLNDPEMVELLGKPLQIGTPFSQRSSTTVINGMRQMRTEFAVEISGPIGSGACRIIATNEGIGQLLVESNGKVYNIDLTSRGTMSSSSKSYSSSKSPSSKSRSSSKSSASRFRGDDDDNIIEAEIIDKETK